VDIFTHSQSYLHDIFYKLDNKNHSLDQADQEVTEYLLCCRMSKVSQKEFKV